MTVLYICFILYFSIFITTGMSHLGISTTSSYGYGAAVSVTRTLLNGPFGTTIQVSGPLILEAVVDHGPDGA
jgi:hypothetical protein